ncbi:phosphoribosylanthranilate isomerase [Halapricum hydrolyticum]|uniref:N-(5'-phosphoribosyl)anthranilate isomerase n=1 Tax=Halapricum hydrolyticum TaxID=2979991 RepID=A0AAE3LER0_9EURY|nr:phosphoribosylanthranilate isomerase [Halapricum hydrolyticum]MCU4718199.1 phosphoribosylanthranilate isomerase [Halapricum hydrolyticum]MCU4726360.1 phosphoribosylanthranilate isomerase [Halapricum hydrolyticum]
MTRVKVCGFTREVDLAAAVAAGVDAVGLIAGVTVETPREIGLADASRLAATVPPLVSTVLVTMPDDAGEARRRIERVRPDAVQLHGLDPADVAALADAPADVIAAVDPTDPDLDAYAGAADALLVDSIDDAGGGGTGETHDWERTREIVTSLDVPVILAGGLTPENVATAVERVDPFAVDVASGVEREGGVKDHDAVGRFVERATRARIAP